MPLAGSASAATQPGKCPKLTTKTVKTVLTATLTGCTPTAATGGKGVGSFKTNPNKSGTFLLNIKWTGTGTTKATVTFKTEKTLRKCPKATGAARVTLTGKLTGGTGAAVKTLKAGQAINGSVCVGPKGYSVEPGTALKF